MKSTGLALWIALLLTTEILAANDAAGALVGTKAKTAVTSAGEAAASSKQSSGAVHYDGSGNTAGMMYDPEETLPESDINAVYDLSQVRHYTQLEYDVLKQFTNESEYTTRNRQKLITYAMQFIGNPYVWGGTDLVNGADCSGFVMQIYRHFGIDTGRTSRDQYRQCIWLKGSQVMPGDLIFYADGDYINHVALYAGNELIIHAANRKSGVKVSRYDYRAPYAYGRFALN